MKSQKAISAKNQRLVKKLHKAWIWHGGNIERACEFARITIKEELKTIEILFNPFPQHKDESKKIFNIKLNQKKVKEFKKLSVFLHGGNKELKKALKTIEAVHQRQYFRNSQILKYLLKEAQVYKKNLEKNSLIKQLCKAKLGIGKEFQDYKKASIKGVKELLDSMNTARKLINKRAYLDDIMSYINFFEDFFSLEEFSFKKLINQSMEKIYEENRNITVQQIEKESELSLELPSWNLFLED